MKHMKSIRSQLQKSLQRSAANLALSSSVLSEQLLIIAASNKNIKLASKVSSISPLGVFGNVRVFEASKSQFSHELFWMIEDGKVKIAEVSDVDEDHLNDAYQAAFDAVCKDVLSQNDLREVSGA